MLNYEEIKLYTWYTFDEGENRQYGYTCLYPIAKKKIVGQPVLAAFRQVNNDSFRPIEAHFEIVWIESDESITEWHDRTLDKYTMIQLIFECKGEELDHIRQFMRGAEK